VISIVKSSDILYSGGWVQLGPLGTMAANRPILPSPGDYDDGEIDRMMIGRGNRSTRRKPVPVPLCVTTTNPHMPAWKRTRASAVRSRRLTAWVTGRPLSYTKDVPKSMDKNINFLLFDQCLRFSLNVFATKLECEGLPSLWQQAESTRLQAVPPLRSLPHPTPTPPICSPTWRCVHKFRAFVLKATVTYLKLKEA
jgi:hypothetical protein